MKLIDKVNRSRNLRAFFSEHDDLANKLTQYESYSELWYKKGFRHKKIQLLVRERLNLLAEEEICNEEMWEEYLDKGILLYEESKQSEDESISKLEKAFDDQLSIIKNSDKALKCNTTYSEKMIQFSLGAFVVSMFSAFPLVFISNLYAYLSLLIMIVLISMYRVIFNGFNSYNSPLEIKEHIFCCVAIPLAFIVLFLFLGEIQFALILLVLLAVMFLFLSIHKEFKKELPISATEWNNLKKAFVDSSDVNSVTEFFHLTYNYNLKRAYIQPIVDICEIAIIEGRQINDYERHVILSYIAEIKRICPYPYL